ncbi:MAG: GNAT family N-acetyltransferase [Clostridiaceae bacterium]|nr:GNAT family N-acetyltransferase [Clostridiaceae bacterium]
METLPVLKTKSLILIPAAPKLTRRVLEYYLRNKAFLEPFEPKKSSNFFTEEAQRENLRFEAHSTEEARSYRYYITLHEDADAIIGSITLSDVVRGAFWSSFLGYKLDERLQGLGYMTEAVSCMTEFGFETIGLHRIEANVMPRNKPSLRVLEKCGYEPEGLAKRYLKINGVWEDHIHMVRLNEEENEPAFCR